MKLIFRVLKNNYQALKSKYTAIEPPTWSLLLAQSMRNFGFNVSIIDANAEDQNEEENNVDEIP